MECGGDVSVMLASPIRTWYCPPLAPGFMTTTATFPSGFTNPVEITLNDVSQGNKTCPLDYNTTVWMEGGGDVSVMLASPIRTWYCPPLAPGFMTTTATFPSGFTNPVASNMLRLGATTMRLAPGRMNFEKWPM